MPAFVMGPPARRLSRSHAPAAAHSPNRRRPGLAALVAGVFLAGLLAPVAIAGTSPNGDAAATWPTHWNAYTYADGSPIADPTGDQSPGYADISSGSPSGSLPSVYLASDGTNVFFRFRLADDPAGAGGFKSTAAVIRINVDGSLAAAVGLDGKSPKTDSVYVTDASGDAVVRVYETPFTSPSAGARSRSDGAGGYFLDLQVPIARIAAVSSSAVTGSTPVTLAFGTSQAANL
ncbi:MAG: hypothetical protein MUC54_04155, partial [Chloroflexi bacterium]|nr:hypothetical protein [Chloroflexota bacterium]